MSSTYNALKTEQCNNIYTHLEVFVPPVRDCSEFKSFGLFEKFLENCNKVIRMGTYICLNWV